MGSCSFKSKMARALSKYIQFTRMRWAEIMAHRQQRDKVKVSRDEFVYYAKTLAAEYQYLKAASLLDHALSGSLGSSHYSQVAKSTTNSEASIAKLFPVSQANEVTRPGMASEPTDEATLNQPERADEPVKLGKDGNNPASAKADTYVSNAVTDFDNETAGEQASDTCEESSDTKNVLVEDKTVLEVNKPLVTDQETPKERGVDGDFEKKHRISCSCKYST